MDIKVVLRTLTYSQLSPNTPFLDPDSFPAARCP